MLVGLLALTTFLGALLLFLIQPLFGKVILPWFGGSPGTWTTCMLAFQSLLLAGYAAAHLASRVGVAARWAGLLLVAVAALALGSVVPGAAERPAPEAEPVTAILMLLLVHVGLPFTALAATSPLTSGWYTNATGREPYFLYAFSNAGSLLGLLAYPFVLEPRLELEGQVALWTAGFAAYVALLVLSGTALLRAGVKPEAAPGDVALSHRQLGRRSAPDHGTPPVLERLRWLLLACVPSVLLLAVTNHITVDVAAAPFLWVLPLVLYLLSFILVFSNTRFYRRAWCLPAWVVASGALAVALLLEAHAGLWLQLGGALSTLFLGCMICHGELARGRPNGARVTEYYLWIAAGGALGGLLTGVAAPLLFVGFFELQLAVIAVYAVSVLTAARAYDEPIVQQRERRDTWRRVGLGVGAVVPLLLVGVIGQLVGFGGEAEVVARRRTFHGTLRVTRLAEVTMLTHGRIGHGMEYRSAERRAEPTMYYGAESGAGLALARHRAGRPRSLGIVGLGVGTLAAFGQAGDHLRFYELDPAVVELARSHFGFLARSRARIDIVIGDGRLSLEREPSRGFDLLLLDAFASDSVPTHLLTVEAFAIYLRHLATGGCLLVNVSNRHLDVERAVAGSAAHHGLAMVLLESPSDVARGWARVRWALVARERETLDGILGTRASAPLAGPPVVWRDSYSDLLSVLRL